MRVTENTFPADLSRSVNDLGTRQARLQTQAATGQRIRNPEDDPSAFRNVLELQGDFQLLGQYSDNITKLQSRTTSVYESVSQLKKVTDRASEIATSAVSIRTSDEYIAYASEVDQLLENALGLSNAQHNGESLFSASSGATNAFEATRDSTGKITSITYSGNSEVRQADISKGVSVPLDILGANTSDTEGPRGLLYDKRSGIDVFGHLVQLRDALKSGDSQAVLTASKGLTADETGYIQTFAEIGANQSRLEAASRQNSSESISLNQLISQESDVDLSQTLVELSQLQAAYSAALQSAGKMLRLSLLDYV